jgi:hypothetical protein
MLNTIYFRVSAFHFCSLNVKIKIQRPVTFLLSLSGFEMWPLTLKVGIRLRAFQIRAFQIRVIKRILGTGRWEVGSKRRREKLAT